MNKLYDWVCRHSLAMIVGAAALQIALFIVVAIMYSPSGTPSTRQEWGNLLAIGVVGVAAVVQMIFSFKVLRHYFAARTLAILEKRAWQLYFCGFSLMHYWESNAFIRLQNWADSGICYEIAAMTMLAAKDIRSARLVRGAVHYSDGRFKTNHSWVEFYVPFCGWMVADFAWIPFGFIPRRHYLHEGPHRIKITPRWRCGGREFWATAAAQTIECAMGQPDTSHILYELEWFGQPNSDSYGLPPEAYEVRKLYTDGKTVLPHFRVGSSRLISSRIVRDFVKNPRRKQPRARNIRLTKALHNHIRRKVACDRIDKRSGRG